MNNEEKLLIELCKNNINSKESILPDNVDYPALFRLAKSHNLAGVCCIAVMKAKNSNAVDKECLADFRDALFDGVYLFEQQTRCLEAVKKILSSANIPHIAFKGAVLRNIYPVPESRVMGDIDILIEPKHRDTVKTLLCESDFVCTAQNGPVFDYQRGCVLVEMHTKIISEFGKNAFSDAFENAVFDGLSGELNANYHLAYLIAHTAHHFKFYGAGIRHILDLAVLQKNADINFDDVLGILKPLRLDDFAKNLLTVCKKWFDEGQAFVENTDKIEQYLCTRGVFGARNQNKGAVLARRELEAGKKVSAFTTKLRLAFPPYSKLKEIPYIRFIDGRPWLTPYAWICRLYFNLKHRRDFMNKAVTSLNKKNTLALAKEEFKFFEEIGLI